MAEQLGFTKEQAEVIDSRNKNLLVSAAAGSGKTTVMIQRVCDLIIKDHVPISKFLIISFTKASASDMKNKLIKKLSSLEPTPFILEQLDDIMTSDVSNLHSFCARLLKAYFYEVGLDPTFVVLDDQEVESCKEKALTKLFNEKAEQGDKDFYELIDIFSRSRKDTGLKRAILKLYNFLCSIVDREGWFESQINNLYNLDLNENSGAKILNSHIKAEKIRCEKLISDLINEANIVNETKLVSYLQSLDSMFNLIRLDSGFYDNAQRLNNKERLPVIPKPTQGREFLYEKAKFLKENVVERFNKLKDYSLSNNIDDIVSDLKTTKRRLMSLYRLTKEFEEKFKVLKKDKGGLDFNDLEQYTLKVLENKDILEEIKNKYDYVFVDEYQDINGVQEEILTRVSRENNRFMVGDVKQSIYRFRLCDPEIFLNKYNLYQSDKLKGELHLLNANFRSKNAILEFVNAIFDDVMTEDFGGVNYKNEARLKAGKESQIDKEKRVELLFADMKSIKTKETKEMDVYSVMEDNSENQNIENQGKAEGLMIAEKIADLINNKKIIDSVTKKPRKVRFSDITILTSSRTAFLNKIIQTLEENGVPVSTDIEGDSLEDEYVFGIKSFLEVVNNYKVDTNLFSCLYSKVFGFTTKELAEIKIMGNSEGFYYNDVLKAYEKEGLSNLVKNKLLNFFNLLNDCRDKAKFMGVRDIALLVVEKQNVKVKISFEPDYEKRMTKLNKFISSLGDQSVVEYLNDQALAEIRCEPVYMGGAVQVMTIHKSKGLEFGVVFLVGINRGFNFKTIYSDLLISKDIGVCLDYYDRAERYKQPTLARQAVKLIETRKMLEEEQRLLYVALTRATDYLYLVGSGDYEDIKTTMPASPTCFLDYFGNMFVNPEDYTGAEFDVKIVDARDLLDVTEEKSERQIIFVNSDVSINTEIKSVFEKQYNFEKSVVSPLKMAVTELISQEDEQMDYVVMFKETDRSSLEKGILQHKVLEQLSLTENKNQLKIKIANMIEEGIISQEESQNIMEEGILKLLENQVFSSLIKSASMVMKEREFYMLKKIDCGDSVLIQGIVDLMLVLEEGLVIIDYKTGNLTEKSIEKYTKQIELYAEAMEESFGKKVVKKYIASLNSGHLLEIKK